MPIFASPTSLFKFELNSLYQSIILHEISNAYDYLPSCTDIGTKGEVSGTHENLYRCPLIE